VVVRGGVRGGGGGGGGVVDRFRNNPITVSYPLHCAEGNAGQPMKAGV